MKLVPPCHGRHGRDRPQGEAISAGNMEHGHACGRRQTEHIAMEIEEERIESLEKEIRCGIAEAIPDFFHQRQFARICLHDSPDCLLVCQLTLPQTELSFPGASTVLVVLRVVPSRSDLPRPAVNCPAFSRHHALHCLHSDAHKCIRLTVQYTKDGFALFRCLEHLNCTSDCVGCPGLPQPR